ncbi:aldose 1-epimerase [Micromonospora pattaloongensis]|uniref:Aldose 1-epimerase n=1 Tax=Micromonospora pattaloongensis TaxID=405436 RepID=A0A1H3SK70_9ACTN|nr:aldose 1-epimerase family protein [Micromonospora pattaloongensis]SDZ38463.1 aldose 1-epimerase [Micromonospora pattaloongensis]
MSKLAAGARPPSGAQWSISAEGHEAVVVEVGGGLRSYRAGGVDYLDGYAEDELAVGGAGQVLAPWPNRIRDGRYTFDGVERQLALTEPTRHNAIHGLVNWAPWRCVAHDTDHVTVEYVLPAQPGYPWTLQLRTRWRVGGDGLGVTHEVVNLGPAPAPFGLAVHPYLRLAGAPVDELSLRLPARTRLQVDDRMLPIAATPVTGGEYDFTEARRIGAQTLDTAFGDVDRGDDGGSAATLTGADGAAVTVWADRAFGWWQVFTADTLPGERRRRAVALEPMTCPPDAFRSGRDLIVLRPGEPWRASWGIRPGAA